MKINYEHECQRLQQVTDWNEHDFCLALALCYRQLLLVESDFGLGKRLETATIPPRMLFKGIEIETLLTLVKARRMKLSDNLLGSVFSQPARFFHVCSFYENEGDGARPVVEKILKHMDSLAPQNTVEMLQMRLCYAQTLMKIGKTSKARLVLSRVAGNAAAQYKGLFEYWLRRHIARVYFELGDVEECHKVIGHMIKVCQCEPDLNNVDKLFHVLHPCIVHFVGDHEALRQDFLACARSDRTLLEAVEYLLDNNQPEQAALMLEKIEDRNAQATARMHVALYHVAQHDFEMADKIGPQEKFILANGKELGLLGRLPEAEFYLKEANRKVLMSWMQLMENEYPRKNNDMAAFARGYAISALVAEGMLAEAEKIRKQVKGMDNMMSSLIASAQAAQEAGQEEVAQGFMKRVEQMGTRPRSSRHIRGRYILRLFEQGDSKKAIELLRQTPNVFAGDNHAGGPIMAWLIKKKDFAKVREFRHIIKPKKLLFQFELAVWRLFEQKKDRAAVDLWIEGMRVQREMRAG